MLSIYLEPLRVVLAVRLGKRLVWVCGLQFCFCAYLCSFFWLHFCPALSRNLMHLRAHALFLFPFTFELDASASAVIRIYPLHSYTKRGGAEDPHGAEDRCDLWSSVLSWNM